MLVLSHKKLDVYKKSLELLKIVYKTTIDFPKEEQFGLVAQIRRAAISVCCNISEGASRLSHREKLRFFEISRSSVVELDTQFEIAMLLGYYKLGQTQELEQYLEDVFRILSKMISNIKS
jgi:four helix bundle protein